MRVREPSVVDLSIHALTVTPDETFLLAVESAVVLVLRASNGTLVRALTGPPGTLQPGSICTGIAVVPSTGEVLASSGARIVRFKSVSDDTVVGTVGENLEWFSPTAIAVVDHSSVPFVVAVDGGVAAGVIAAVVAVATVLLLLLFLLSLAHVAFPPREPGETAVCGHT